MSSGPHIALAATSLAPNRRAVVAEALVLRSGAWAEAAGAELACAPKLENEVWSVVLKRPETAFDRLVDLMERVWPEPLRAALVSVGHHEGEAAMARARARAAEALAQAAREGVRFRIHLAGRGDHECRLAEHLALLHAVVSEGWTATRHHAVRAYREFGRQKDVAERLGVTQQAVSQMLRGARLRELQAVEEAMRGWFAQPARPGLWPLKNLSLETAAGA
ncbi:MAG: hypothetical protein D6702_02215 [Planctomycetota bacterium]|nr:MAG: hypothetical protein D6702_02215 [Planctomycetota bacterium]